MVQRLIDWRNPMRQTQRIAGIGSSLIVLGTAFIVYQIYLKQEQAKTSFTKAKEMGMTNSIEFYRTELTRQRNFHSGMWFWSRIVIFTPGPLIFMAGFAVAHPPLAKISAWRRLRYFSCSSWQYR
jgi:hypothetical protein